MSAHQSFMAEEAERPRKSTRRVRKMLTIEYRRFNRLTGKWRAWTTYHTKYATEDDRQKAIVQLNKGHAFVNWQYRIPTPPEAKP